MATRKAARATKKAKKSASRKAGPTRKAAGRASARQGARKKVAAKASGSARRVTARKAAARKAARKKTPLKKAAPKKTAAKKAAAKRAAPRKAALRKAAAGRATPKKVAVSKAKPAAVRPAVRSLAAPKAKAAASRPAPPKTTARQTSATERKAPALNRARRTVLDDDDIVASPPSTLDMDRTASSARSGRQAMDHRLHDHNESSPALTAGDVDADWESAYSVGDEAPGGDSPTPDQDIVDDIGRAVGNVYQDNEPLKGADKIIERDKHRWELDPGSKEDWDDRDD